MKLSTNSCWYIHIGVGTLNKFLAEIMFTRALPIDSKSYSGHHWVHTIVTAQLTNSTLCWPQKATDRRGHNVNDGNRHQPDSLNHRHSLGFYWENCSKIISQNDSKFNIGVGGQHIWPAHIQHCSPQCVNIIFDKRIYFRAEVGCH